MTRTLFLSLATSFLICCTGFSQDIEKAKLDTYFEVLEDNNRFMGSVAASKDGEIIYSKSVGFADISRGLKASEKSKYRIASITKTFTAVLILQAVDERKLELNQTIDKYFPTVGNADKITIEHLLRHRSGLYNFTDSAWTSWYTEPKTEKEMIEIIIKGGNDFEPDTKMAYSNSGFVLLTYILEKIYEKPFSNLLEEKISRPIGLENTYLGGKINTENGECNSYTFHDKNWKLETEAEMSQLLGAGAMTSTTTDLIKFSNALFSGKLISEESLQKMITMKDYFGMGLVQMPFYEHIGFGHTGGLDGFGSLLIYFPANNISFVYISNGMNFNGNEIAITVLSAVYGKPFEIPEFAEFTNDELENYVGIYSSQQIPLKITISKLNIQLFGQATGQPSFPLEATGKDRFEFRQAGIVLEFNLANKTMILRQGGGVFNFALEE
jgi:CubicO group peptidase (beta-lactamase class C family)